MTYTEFKNWIAGAIKHPGALRAALHVKRGKKISAGQLRKASHSKNLLTARRARLALTLKHFTETDMVKKIVDAFKAGTYPQGTFTEKELNEIVDSYDPKNYEAPVTIGHVSDYPRDSRIPAWGWVKGIIKEGKHLKFVTDFTDEMVDLMKRGLYKTFSVGLYAPNDPNNPTPGKWHLNHFAILGGASPAVKGLQPVQMMEFSSFDNSIIIQFEDGMNVEDMGNYAEQALDDTLSNYAEEMAGHLAECEDIHKDESLTPQAKFDKLQGKHFDHYQAMNDHSRQHFGFEEKHNSILDRLKDKAGEYAEFFKAMLNNKQSQELTDMDAKQLKDELTKEFSEQLKTAIDPLKTENAALKKELEAAKDNNSDEALRLQIKNFCDEQRIAGKYIPAMDELGYPETMFALAKSGVTKEFSEKNDKGEVTKVKKTALQLFQEQITHGEAKVNFGEGLPPEDEKVASVAKKYIQKNGFVDPHQIRQIMFAEQHIKANPTQYKGTVDQQLSKCLSDILEGKVSMEA